MWSTLRNQFLYTLFIQYFKIDHALERYFGLNRLALERQILRDQSTRMSQGRLDNKRSLRTLPRSPSGAYYERREAYCSPCFTPARVYARAAHHLPRVEHGVEPPVYQLRESSESKDPPAPERRLQRATGRNNHHPTHLLRTGEFLIVTQGHFTFQASLNAQNVYRLRRNRPTS